MCIYIYIHIYIYIYIDSQLTKIMDCLCEPCKASMHNFTAKSRC